ncbi:hypothetical protein MASR2M15_05370 [Anaerolineales bacterium]
MNKIPKIEEYKKTKRLDDSLLDNGVLDKHAILPWMLEFRVIGTPHVIKAPVSQTLLLGRIDGEQEIYPEVDLTQFGGRDTGVSRRHAIIIAKDNRVTLEDLGSSNGSFVNDERVKPNESRRIYDGDTIQLGKLKLQVRFVVKPKSQENTILGLEEQFTIEKVGTGQPVLIVEDDEKIVHYLHVLFTMAGFKVKSVLNGANALIEMEKNFPRILVVGQFLPDFKTDDVVSSA